MLGLIEKLQYWFSGLILFLVVALYFVLGGPESRAYVPPVVESKTEVITAASPESTTSPRRPRISAA